MKKIMFTLMVIMLVPMVVFGAELPDLTNDTEGQLKAIAQLITNWKVLGTWGILMAVVNLIVGVLKSDWTDKYFTWNDKAPFVKRLIIVVLGQVLTVIVGLSLGQTLMASVIAGLVTSGGAMAIYEAAKPLFSKEEVPA